MGFGCPSCRSRHRASPLSFRVCRLVVVTASTQGIGLGIAERLGLEGAKVVISSRKQRGVDEALEYLRGKGIQCHGQVLVLPVPDPSRLPTRPLGSPTGSLPMWATRGSASSCFASAFVASQGTPRWTSS